MIVDGATKSLRPQALTRKFIKTGCPVYPIQLVTNDYRYILHAINMIPKHRQEKNSSLISEMQ
jgi:hypothetical protein